jgi:hypothetical protein
VFIGVLATIQMMTQEQKSTKGGNMRKPIPAITFLLTTVALLGLLALSCAAAKDVPRMTKDELKSMLGSKDLVLIDVRVGKDWDEPKLKIKGAVREEPKDFDSWYGKYPKDKTLVLYCS